MIISYKIRLLDRQGKTRTVKTKYALQDEKNLKISHEYIFPVNETNISNHQRGSSGMVF